MVFTKRSWLVPLLTTGLAACLAPPEQDIASRSLLHSQQLVIQFKLQTDACNSAGIATLSQETGVSLALVRPMDNEACVVNQFAAHPAHFLEQQRKVAAHYSVRWVEPDQRMRAF